ncbi:MAG: ABC transporter permease [Alphaproteobacteria bacterium]|nr:ABC transporter permease [Alphaproteobacteria bacterium]
MIRLLAQRLLYMALTLWLVSVVAFVLIQLPPGDYAETYLTEKQQSGAAVSQEELQNMRQLLGIDRPWHAQYLSWATGIVTRGDFGYSFEWRRPVTEVIGERLPLTLVIASCTLVFMYAVSLPIGIYSAVRQYSIADHAFSLVGYVGLATPNFLLALVLMYMGQQWFGQSVGGLFSPQYAEAPWSLDRLVDLAAHLWVPIVVLGMAGTANLIRSMRALMLDELGKMYVVAARASGLSPLRLLLKYPVRMAINPIVATLGWRLTFVISGAPIVGVVMALPDTGPLFLHALLNQDMQLAGAMVFIYCALTILGTFVSDLLLVVVDPRIKMS